MRRFGTRSCGFSLRDQLLQMLALFLKLGNIGIGTHQAAIPGPAFTDSNPHTVVEPELERRTGVAVPLQALRNPLLHGEFAKWHQRVLRSGADQVLEPHSDFDPNTRRGEQLLEAGVERDHAVIGIIENEALQRGFDPVQKPVARRLCLRLCRPGSFELRRKSVLGAGLGHQ